MATPKSANERIRRKLRKKKVSPDNPSGDQVGKVVSKKPANNDPDRKHRIYKDEIAKEFLDFYKTGDGPSLNFLPLIENLISIAVENAGRHDLPYELGRLNELRESVLSEDAYNFDINPQNFNIPEEKVQKMFIMGIISRTEYIYYLVSIYANKINEVKNSVPDIPEDEWDNNSTPDKYQDHADAVNSMVATIDNEFIDKLKEIL